MAENNGTVLIQSKVEPCSALNHNMNGGSVCQCGQFYVNELGDLVNSHEDAAGSIAHAIWAHWMEYFFSQCYEQAGVDGLVVPQDKVARWKRQMRTGYWDLPEKEKESDRRVGRDFLMEYLTKNDSIF